MVPHTPDRKTKRGKCTSLVCMTTPLAASGVRHYTVAASAAAASRWSLSCKGRTSTLQLPSEKGMQPFGYVRTHFQELRTVCCVTLRQQSSLSWPYAQRWQPFRFARPAQPSVGDLSPATACSVQQPSSRPRVPFVHGLRARCCPSSTPVLPSRTHPAGHCDPIAPNPAVLRPCCAASEIRKGPC